MNLLLQPVITDCLFSGDDILHSDFLETIIGIRGRGIFTKQISARGNCFLPFFSNTDANGSSFSVQ